MTLAQYSERYHGVCSRCRGWGFHHDEYTNTADWRPWDPQKGESDGD